MGVNFIPTVITAGLTFKIKLSFDNFPASNWQGTLMLRGPSTINIQATACGDSFIFYADAATTAAWKPGDYWFAVRGSSGDDVIEMRKGEIAIAPDIANVPTGFDGRTYAERVLEAIDAVIEKRASMDQQSYRINDRELSRTPIADLLTLRNQFRAEVNREKARRLGKNTFNRRIMMVMK